ncbi:MAG: MoaD/ThiS family protein [Desulfurococcales archaeon]|nr:MoaD/ThiS family protein [Desulfurococcales archaeon]
MGRVRVRYLGYLAEYAGGREVEVEVGESGARLIEVVRLPPDVSPDDLVFLVNGRPAKPGDRVRPGDTVSVMPHISGGAPAPSYIPVAAPARATA